LRTYILRRVLLMIPLLVGVSIVVFAMVRILPGDVATLMVAGGQDSGASARNEETIQAIRRSLNLDQPLHIQYALWLGQVARGDLGYSMQNGEEIAPEALLRLAVTVQLTIPSLVISVVLGVVLGTLAAVYQYSWFDQIVSFVTYVLMAVPGFLLGLGAIAVIALQLRWLPPGTMYDPATNGALGDRLLHLMMPLAVIGISGSVGIIRFTRTSVLEVMRQEYVTVARAKGIGESAIRARHILRNALVPVLTIVGYHLPGLFGGSALFETVFLFPGLGQWAANAASAKDYPVMMVVITVTAILIVLSNLLVDIAYAAVDPRIVYS
jgi:peptide/nickel transport system permease protein